MITHVHVIYMYMYMYMYVCIYIYIHLLSLLGELEMPLASLWNTQSWAFKMLSKYYMNEERMGNSDICWFLLCLKFISVDI